LAAGPRQAGGQPEPVPDGLLDLLLAGPGVDCDDVLLAAEDVQPGIGLRVVFAEPDGERFLGVVLAPDQLAAAGVALPLYVPPEDVPDRDVLEVELLGEQLRVSSLAARSMTGTQG
jgi:hypothetical protein